MHTISAKAVCFKEALDDSFRTYAKQVVSNAKALADRLVENGLSIVSGGTDNHLMLVDLRPVGLTGKTAEKYLDDIRITANKNGIPFDPEKPFVTSGLRLGSPAVTTRGFKEEDMVEVADIITMVLNDYEGKKAEGAERVKALTDKFPLYE